MLAAHYDYRLVALSIFIAIFAAYAAVGLAERVTAAKGGWKGAWIAGGACAMGLAIWSMHYVGMLAFELPVAIRYDIGLVLASMIAAIGASAIALVFVSQESLSRLQLSCGAIAMGSGIAGMHYIGMAAMRMTCTCSYDWRVVALSVAIAIIVSGIALTALRMRSKLIGLRKIAAGVLLGLAISSMHYTGMAAAHFSRSDRPLILAGTANISWVGGVAIATGTLLLLAITVLTSLAGERFSAQSSRLYSTEERYRVLFERSVAGIYIARLDGTVVDMNQTCVDLLGYERREDVIGKKVRTVHLSEEMARTYVELLVTQKQFPPREMKLIRTDGSLVWVLLSATLLEFRDGGPPEIQGMLLGIEALKHTEDELRLAKYSAESASLAKTQFLANMSHELRTPLNGVLGMTQLLNETPLSGEQKEYLELANSSAKMLLGLIDHILEFSRTEAGQAITSSEEFDLRKVLREEVSWGAPFASEKRIRMRCEVSPDVAERFWGEPRWIRQILSGLLSNALRFTSRGEIAVTVSARTPAQANQTVAIAVRDTGVGIAPDKQLAIFEPFTQADDSNTRSVGGAGLGLSLVRNLAKAMGGQVSLESQPGTGSVFSVTLPLRTQPAEIVRPAA
ncbi:MAG: PAS domain S-box protein [Acidobacteriaceae bacterium]|nr:PAS domain S-box protein [Acidobacteriaceae bacterium]